MRVGLFRANSYHRPRIRPVGVEDELVVVQVWWIPWIEVVESVLKCCVRDVLYLAKREIV
jgi:hypothetical protein